MQEPVPPAPTNWFAEAWEWIWTNVERLDALRSLLVFAVLAVAGLWGLRRVVPKLRARCRIHPFFGLPVETPDKINQIIWTVANKTDDISKAITRILDHPTGTEANYSKTVSQIHIKNHGHSTFKNVRLHVKYPFFVITRRTGRLDQRANYTRRQSPVEVLEFGDMGPGDEVHVTIWAAPGGDDFQEELALYHSHGRGRMIVYGMAHPFFWRLNRLFANSMRASETKKK